jgi:hypothetical protein
MNRLLASALLLLPVLACGGSQRADELPSFSVTFAAEADEGVALGGVMVRANGNEVGLSDADGLVQTTLRGPEGVGVEITYECPTGHLQPDAPKMLRLHSFRALTEDARIGLHMKLDCPPAERTVAFVVHTNGHEGLPVKIDGEEVARTNSAGIAHIVQMTSSAPRVFRMQLDTSANMRMRPANPSTTFQFQGNDDLFVLAQNFEVEAPPTMRRRRRRMRQAPIRITRIGH